MKNFTLPGDTVPLANWAQDFQDALLSARNPTAPTPADRDRIWRQLIEIAARPEMNAMLDRIIPGRRQK